MRVPDWKDRLTQYLLRVNTLPISYGENDCALFLAGGVEAMTGVDYAAGFRGTYVSGDLAEWLSG